jgi:DNA helicase-2/ATP-dependent DNA helicase PcrA
MTKKKLMKLKKLKKRKKNLTKLTNTSSSATSNTDLPDLSIGLAVEHARFGRGQVILLEGVGQNQKATIDFGAHGKKQLILKFAKLKVLP